MGDILPIVIAVVFLLFVALMGMLILGKSSPQNGKKGKRHKKIRSSDHAQIVKEANRRLAQNPKDPEALQALGEIYYSEQAWEKAFKIYEVLMDVAAGNPEVDEFTINRSYGLCALKMNRFEEAYKGLVVAHAIRQDDFETGFNLGYLEFQRRQYEKAVLY
nr:hypothetical protein [Spirochaetia bacterium]